MSTVVAAKKKLSLKTDFEEIYRTKFKEIHLKLAKKIGDFDLAEELTQAAFIAAWQHLDRYEERGIPPQVYILRIASNRYISHMRKESRSAFSIDESHPNSTDDSDNYHESFPDPFNELDWVEDEIYWDWLMTKLPARLSFVMTQRFKEGRTSRDIGIELGIPERTVASRIYSAATVVLMHMKETYESNLLLSAPARNGYQVRPDLPSRSQPNRSGVRRNSA